MFFVAQLNYLLYSLHIEAVCITLIFSTLKVLLFLELHKKYSFFFVNMNYSGKNAVIMKNLLLTYFDRSHVGRNIRKKLGLSQDDDLRRFLIVK